jgi:predicted protein tyrosine phosphatase
MSTWFRTYGFAEIRDDLVIGAYPQDAEDVSMLEWMGVQHVVNLVEDEEYGEGARDVVAEALSATGISEERVSFADFGHLPADELEAAVQAVCRGLDDSTKTYLHCRAGQQRSAVVAAGVVALRQHLNPSEALAFIQQRKPSATPLPHQLEDLERWWDARSHALPEAPNADGPPRET